MRELFKTQKMFFLLLSFVFCFNQLYSQNKCFSEETIKFHKESKDNSNNIEWLIKAAEANHAYSLHDLGLLYVNGNHIIAVDFKKAFNYFEKSAHLGVHNSMRSLGILWQFGDGRKINLSKAYAWYKLAGDFVPTNWDEWHMPRSKVLMFKKLAPNLAKKMKIKEIKAGDKYYKKIKSKVKCNFNSWLYEQL